MKDVAQGQDVCRKCAQVIPVGARFCACGRPTALATFEERNAWEAKQWRTYKAQAS